MSLTVAWILGGVLAAAGLGVAVWALYWDRARGRKRCPKCWYDLSGAAGDVKCPECGWVMKSERQLLQTRRRWRAGTAGLVALAVGMGWPALRTMDSWWEAVPTPVLFWIVAERGVPAERATDYLRFSVLRGTFRPGWSRDWTTSLAIEYLRHGTVPQRQLSADALQYLGPPERIVGPLTDAISDPAPFVSLRALRSLAMVKADAALPHILRIAGDAAAPIPHRREAFSLLAEYGVPTEAASAACIVALSEPWMDLHEEAAQALGRVMTDPAPAVEALTRVLDNDDEETWTKRVAATGLARCGSAAASAVPSLVRALKAGVFECIGALARIGPAARDATGVLGEIAGSGIGSVPVEARAAVLVISGAEPSFADALAAYLGDPDAGVRAGAAIAMGELLATELGGQCRVLATLLNDPDLTVRAQACMALGRAGLAAGFALDQLKSLAASDPAIGVQRAAAQAARRIERAKGLGR